MIYDHNFVLWAYVAKIYVPTVAMMVPQATAYYVSGVKIDNASITPIWQGASALSTGNANSIDVYTFTIIRTGTSTYKVFSSRTQYIHTG